MTETVLTTLISSGFVLLGTIITVITTAVSNRKKTGTKIDTIEQKLDAHIREDEYAQAKQTRIRILRFNDELCAGGAFSENHFEEVIDDIDFYETFCEKHKDYHNNKGKMAMEHIKSEYQRLKADNKFLH